MFVPRYGGAANVTELRLICKTIAYAFQISSHAFARMGTAIGLLVLKLLLNASSHLDGDVLIVRQRISIRTLHDRGQILYLGVVVVFVQGWLQDDTQHLGHFLGNEWNRPLEHVHEIRQVIWMRCVVKLQYIQGIVLEPEHAR